MLRLAETRRPTLVVAVGAAVVIVAVESISDAIDGRLMWSELMHCTRTYMDSV